MLRIKKTGKMMFRKMLLFIRKFLLGFNPAKIDGEYFDGVTGAIS